MNAVGLVSAVVDDLLVGLMHTQLYGAKHARVHASGAAVAARVAEYCADGAVDSLQIGIAGDRLIFEMRPLLNASIHARKFILRLREWKAGGVRLHGRTSSRDVVALLDVLTRRGERTGGHVEGNTALDAMGATAVRFLPPPVGDGSGTEGGASASAEDLTTVALHQRTVELLQDATIRAVQGRDIYLGEVRGCMEEIAARVWEDAPSMLAEAQYQEYDAYTFGHSIRVCLLSLNAARPVVSDARLLNRIGTAALMHDVGKALIPFELLHKQGRLSAEERREMSKHPQLGAAVLLANRESDPMAVASAYGHHRTRDGHGYPRTRADYEQSMITRLVKICDCFEALTAVRPYKPPMSPAKAYRVMLEMKGHFDEALLRHFMRVTGIYPSGSHVKLDSGDVARVLRQTGDLDRPVVEVVARSDGSVVEIGARTPVDLSVPAPGGPPKVLALLPTSDASAIVA